MLSLKTVHRTVFLTVAFKSRYQFACKTKKQTNKKVNLFFMVRVVIQNFLKKPVISTVFKADE